MIALIIIYSANELTSYCDHKYFLVFLFLVRFTELTITVRVGWLFFVGRIMHKSTPFSYLLRYTADINS